MLHSFYNSSQIADCDKWSQINTLKMFNECVEELDPGRLYKVPFKSGNVNFDLKVQLTDLFPDQRPILVLNPIASHQWIDNMSGEVVAAPGLLNFTKHSDLGRVVHVIIRELSRNPLNLMMPTIKNQTNFNSLTKCLMDLQIDYNENQPYQQHHQTYRNSISCDYQNQISCSNTKSTLYPELNSMTIEELRNFNKYSDVQLEQFLDDHNYKKLITNRKSATLSDINEIIEENLLKENEYNSLKNEVSIKRERLDTAIRRIEGLQKEHNFLSDKYSPDNICKLLEIETTKIDCSSESIATRFLNSEETLTSFLNEYTETRKLYYVRKSKEDRLKSQLNQLKEIGF